MYLNKINPQIMLKKYYKLIIILIFFKFYKINSIFEPNLTFIKNINQHLSLPYYAEFNKCPDKSGQYSLWISNNPYGSCFNEHGYIAHFKYNPKNAGFVFMNKICTPNVLGLAPCDRFDTVYPGIRSYPAITINNKYVLEASVKSNFYVYNSYLDNCNYMCNKGSAINSYVLGGMPGNIQLSNFVYFFNGAKYQLLTIPFNIKDRVNQNQVLSNIYIFDYALNKSILNQPLTPILRLNIDDIPINIPKDAKISPFACSDGSYLLAVSNLNSSTLSLLKLNISDPSRFTCLPFQSIDIGDYQQYFIAFSNNRYMAVSTTDVADNNIYVYYFDQDFNIFPLNNNKPYKTGILPQALTWSPDSKLLIIPNYLDNNFTVYQANTCDFKLKLKPKVNNKYSQDSVIITAKVYNGTPPYTFYFSNGNVITQESNICKISVSPDKTTIYNATAVDVNNCITGIADPITVQVARPVVTRTIANCAKNSINICGKILDPYGLPVICTTMGLYINNNTQQKEYVTSDKDGNFSAVYNIKK